MAGERAVSNSSRTGILTPQRIEISLCALAIATGLFLRVFRFWEASLWLDEFGTAHVAAARDWATFWQRCILEHHPPLYYLLVKLSLLFGHTEFFLRLPTVCAGVASVGLLFATVKRALGIRAAFYAAAIYALNTRAIILTQEARMYGLTLFLTTASLYAMTRFLDDPRRLWLFAYACSTLMLSYSHIMYISVLVIQITGTLIYLLRSEPRSPNAKRLFGFQMIVASMLAPLAPILVSITGSRKGVYGWIPPPDLQWLLEFVKWPEISLVVVLLPGILTILWTHRNALLRGGSPVSEMLGILALLYTLMWTGAVVLARLAIVNVLQPRYLLPSLLGVVILAGFLQKTGEPFFRIGLCSYLGLCLYFQLAVFVRYGPWSSAFSNQDWRSANEWLEHEYRPGDVVLLRSGITHVKTRSPDEPGAQDYLAAPVQGFYSRKRMRVLSLPWIADELDSSPFTPVHVQRQLRSAHQVFVLVNPVLVAWDWSRFESWMRQADSSPHLIQARTFKGLQLRQYCWEQCPDVAADSASN